MSKPLYLHLLVQITNNVYYTYMIFKHLKETNRWNKVNAKADGFFSMLPSLNSQSHSYESLLKVSM